ncbi:amidase signature enzyme [Xylariomycetidae sp. FL0641]|nr:amidase signature enzyme [Xylariomycetidae sp. FL0641]
MASEKEISEKTIQALRKVASDYGFQMRPQDEGTYLSITEATQKSIALVDDLPDYIDPKLTPNLGADKRTRTHTRPADSENPMNAWMFRTHLQAENQQDGLVGGRTVAIKDTVSIAGVPMTGGTQPYHLCRDASYPVADVDAPVISRILESGAAITGTSTCENYCLSGMSCTGATGPVENPWLPGYSSGGSSSGSAALVAVRTVKKWREARGLPARDLGEGADFALGGDQGGSIRLPASYSGIYGLKPTHGLVPYTGIASHLPMIDHCGPMTSSIRDAAVLLTVIAGYDGFDPRMTPETPLRNAVPQYHAMLDQEIASRDKSGTWDPTAAGTGLRVGVLKEAFEENGVDPEVATVVRKAAARFKELGAVVEEVSVPLHTTAAHIFTAVTRASAADDMLFQASPKSLSFPFPAPAAPEPSQAWYETMTETNPLVPGVLLSGMLLRDRSRYPERMRNKAIRHVHELRAAYDGVLNEFDVLIMPATPTVAPRHADRDMDSSEKAAFFLSNTANTMPFNITGHPAFVMPVGWGKVADADAKLPVGMQIVGKRWDEARVFLAAAAWEVRGHGLDEE